MPNPAGLFLFGLGFVLIACGLWELHTQQTWGPLIGTTVGAMLALGMAFRFLDQKQVRPRYAGIMAAIGLPVVSALFSLSLGPIMPVVLGFIGVLAIGCAWRLAVLEKRRTS